jgi:hypothetical protein
MRHQISAATSAAVSYLLRKTIAEHPPIAAHSAQIEHGSRRPIGTYLLSLGYVTPSQLGLALQEQREQRERYAPSLLGNVLMSQYSIHPKVLTAVLLMQMMDRLFYHDALAPRPLGEHLVLAGALSPLQIAPALQYQLLLRQLGRQVRLGDVLVDRGLLDQRTLALALELQQQQHKQSMKSL